MLKEEERILESVAEKKGTLDLCVNLKIFEIFEFFVFGIWFVFKFSLVFFFSALMGVAELAKGIQYDKPIKTG